MPSRTLRRASAMLGAALLALTLLTPGASIAAQDEPETPAVPEPSPTPNRAPTYQRGTPAGALRIPGEPPAVGAVIVEDPLTSPGVIPGGSQCVSGRNRSEFVGEGYIVKVTGRCFDGSKSAAFALPPIPDLDIPDGEIRLEAKVVSGHDRAGLFMAARGRLDPVRVYEFNYRSGVALLLKASGETVVPLALRPDLAPRVSRDDWNEFAIRLNGPDIWVLVNGEPILSATDAAFDRGWISFGVSRAGNLEDDEEVAVVFRNLRISQLAGGP